MKKLILLLTCLALIGCSQNEEAVSVLNNPAPANSQFPFLYSTGNQLYMSWLTHHHESDTYTLSFATYSEGSWSDIQTVAEGKSWFVNYADFPSIIADRQGPVAVHWLDKIPAGAFAYNVNISLKKESGEWTPPVIPHSDSTATEHGFVSMIPWNSHSILVVWLDGRQSAHSESPQDYYDLDNAMTLRGALISYSGEIIESFLIDDSVCDCCQTTLIKTNEGALVAYRNRTKSEIRDIYVSRFNGTDWSKPEAVYHDRWKINACPVNGPKLASGDSLIVVAWPTAGQKNLAVKAAVSHDGGKTFNDPLIVSQNTLGRVDAAIHNNSVYVSWLQKTPQGASIKLAKLGLGKSKPQTVTVAKIDAPREIGFPQLEVLGDSFIMAWTFADSTSTQIKTVRIDM